MVLLFEKACRQGVGRIGLEDGYDALQDDRTPIELGRHKMDRDTGDLDPVIECLSLRIHTGKRREKRRVDVQDPIGKSLDHRAAQHTHEPGEAHNIHASLLKLFHQRAVIVIA